MIVKTVAIKHYIEHRKDVTPEAAAEIQAWMQFYGEKFKERKQTIHLGNKVSLYGKALESADGEEEQTRIVNQALDFLDGVFCRDPKVGTIIDFQKGFKPGHCLDDGTILENCPKCGRVGIVMDEIDFLSKTIHEARVTLMGYEALHVCELTDE